MSKKGIAIALASILGVSALTGGAYAISRINGNDWFAKPTGNITISTNNNTTALQFEELNKKLNSYMAQVEVLESEKALLQKQLEEKETAYNELLADATATTEALVNARKELVQLTLDMEAKQAEVDEQKALIDELNAEIVALQTAYDELQELYSNATLEKSVFEQLLNGTLTSLKIPDSVTSLSNTFISSDSITSIDLNNVTYLKSNCFFGLKQIEYLDLKNVTQLQNNVFANSSGTASKKLKVIVGNKVNDLSSDSFAYCSSVLELLDLSGCETIYFENSNSWFRNLTSIITKLPDISQKMCTSATFYMNSKYIEVGNILLPEKNGYIKFLKNSQNVCFKGNEFIDFSRIMFDSGLTDTSVLTFYVQDELLKTYKTATGWVDYADQIKPLSEMPEGIDTVEYYQTA